VLFYGFREDELTSNFKTRNAARSVVDIAGYYNYSSQWYPCILYDLSTSGAGLKINQLFIPGDIIRLRFGFKDDQRVVEATVANVNGTRIGVRFAVDSVTLDFLSSVIQTFHRPTKLRSRP